MSELLQALVLGIVQGVCEFLPISSTAHLVLVPYFTGWQDPGLTFDVALHLGTLLAVIGFFWKDWMRIFYSAGASLKHGYVGFKKEILFYLIIGTIPGVVFGLLLEKKAETVFRSPILIAIALIVAGAILYLADSKFKGGKNIKDVSLVDAILVGLAQAVAIIPGVSRSGATITAGLWRGLDRMNAARFSFLLSTPIIAGAAILKLPLLLKSGFSPFLLTGIIASAVSGFFAIKYLLKFLEKFGYKVFFWYRLALGVIIIYSYFN